MFIFLVNIVFTYAMFPASDATGAYAISKYTRYLKYTPKRNERVTRKADLQTLLGIKIKYVCTI